MTEKKLRTFKWTPDCFSEDKEGDGPKQLYSGHIVLKAIPSLERTRQIMEISASKPKAADDQDAQLSWLLGIYEKHHEMMLSAEVVRVSDGMKMDLEDVLHEEALLRLPMEFAGKFSGGFGPGNG